MGKPSEKKGMVVEGTRTNGKSTYASKEKNGRKPPVIKQVPKDVTMGDATPSGSESDVPLAKRMVASNQKQKGIVNGESPSSKQKSVKAEEESSESDSQMLKFRRRPKRIVVSESEESEDDVPLSQKVAKSTGSSSKPSKSKSLDAPVKEEKVDNKQVKRKRMDSESEGDDRNIISKSDPKKTNKKVTPKKVPNEKIIKKEDVETSSKEETPVAKRMGKTNGKKTVVVKQESQDSDSDVPLAKRLANKNKATSTQLSPKVTAKSPSVKTEAGTQETRAPVKNNKSQVKRKRNDSDSEFDDKKQVAKSKSSAKGAIGSKKSGPERKKKKEYESLDEKMSEKKRGKQKANVKWTKLEHNGVYFPPPYVPHNVKMKYDGKEITLTPEAEEVASFYAAMINTDYGKNPTFIKNFFKDWKEILKKSPENPKIEDFNKCDFMPIFDHFEREKELKKNKTKEEKARLKEEKLKLEEKYGYCILDGRREKVGNFRIEPPGLFRGRGAHPKCGKLKQRVLPEQVTINIGKDAPVPQPPKGHRWKEVIHDNTVTWLATWKENINSNIKYVFLAANSSLKGQSDLLKFDKARELKNHIARIRGDYNRDLKEKLTAKRQMATVIYLIDRLALRAGNEKDTKHEADTVGCCSLRVEHIKLKPPNVVTFDFLGKDSIRYQNTVEVEETVFKNLKIFMKGKNPKKDFLFDRVTTTDLNKHLSEYMKGLTAKVFRTYNASYTFQNELKKRTDPNSTIAEKILSYNRANREVAVLCNHQRSVSKAHDNQMNKISDKLRSLKYQRMKAKKAILALDSRMKKKRPDLSEPESDLEEDWIIEYEKQLMEKEREKVRKKFEKDNETRKEENKKPLSEKDLDRMLQEVDEKEKELEKERKSGKVEPKKNQTVEKLEHQIEKLDGRIQETKLAIVEKDEMKTTALGTSKINYIDPRISAAWCLKYKVPTEKIFNKSLRDKFKWALDVVDADWVPDKQDEYFSNDCGYDTLGVNFYPVDKNPENAIVCRYAFTVCPSKLLRPIKSCMETSELILSKNISDFRRISFKTQLLYALVFLSRYLDLFTSWVSLYNTVMKIFFIASSLYVLYLMKRKFRATYDPNLETFRIEFLLIPCILLALIFHYDFTFMEISWAFSVYLEAVAILPQLFMLSRTGEAETITTHYLFALGLYRAFYLLNWLWRYKVEHHVDWIVWIAGAVQTALYSDFFYIYYKKVLHGQKFKLPQLSKGNMDVHIFLTQCRVNVEEGPSEERHMTTGLHIVKDIFCSRCRSVLGWKYEKAYEQSQRYKEGKYILEKQLLTDVN
ncbi:7741_t:CDS:10 [Acaulospora morrowiae]|uniref:ER lumen protein-retaining receptor n=1 Tax=Acaulospora morrowiae TaxID=94023 RepID=A0A9N8W9N4_9GLOM|nr:7741_t:CDS:10 [Acaulospora morrowiae]